MKRIRYHRYGGPEEMRLETFELAAPAKDEIMVRVKAATGKPGVAIGRTARLNDAIALIGNLEAGRRTQGKAVIVMT